MGTSRLEARGVESSAWFLPSVQMTCSKCGQAFTTQDLRRETVKVQRAKCPACGTHINREYRDILRQRDEDEKIELLGGRVVVFTRTQLFMLEVARHLNQSGEVNNQRLVAASVHALAQSIAVATSLGLLELTDKNSMRTLYRITPLGRQVVAMAAARYESREER